MIAQAELFDLPVQVPSTRPARPVDHVGDLASELASFREFGEATRTMETCAKTFDGSPLTVPTFVNEFWTARQRQAHSLHEISYRACFKPQLPRFFIERITQPGERVYDPFMGRGTTPLEAALLGRVPLGCDVNPLSITLTRPRLRPPTLEEVAARLRHIDFADAGEQPEELLAFYHPSTLLQISALRKYLQSRRDSGALDSVDDWISLVALNRLTGHSRGFFSVYTLPPNQATSVKAQRKINEKRGQVPPPRDVPHIVLRKTGGLLSDCTLTTRRTLEQTFSQAQLLTGLSEQTPEIASGSVRLVVTSPPFLDVVQYDADNWLRSWFLGIDVKAVRITMLNKLEAWQSVMTAVFKELHRVLALGGHVAFEVGEVRGGSLKLEEAVLPCGVAAGLAPELILINDQEFTKTANCWGVNNMYKGTNTNRIVLFRKPG